MRLMKDKIVTTEYGSYVVIYDAPMKSTKKSESGIIYIKGRGICIGRFYNRSEIKELIELYEMVPIVRDIWESRVTDLSIKDVELLDIKFYKKCIECGMNV